MSNGSLLLCPTVSLGKHNCSSVKIRELKQRYYSGLLHWDRMHLFSRCQWGWEDKTKLVDIQWTASQHQDYQTWPQSWSSVHIDSSRVWGTRFPRRWWFAVSGCDNRPYWFWWTTMPVGVVILWDLITIRNFVTQLLSGFRQDII